MAATYYIILTDVGAAKIAASQSGGAAVTLSTIQVGDSNGVYYEPVSTQTALVREVWSGAITTLTQDTLNPSTYTAETVIPASVGGFYIREAGLYDTTGALIAIGKYPLIQKTVALDGAAEDVAIRFLIKVSSTSNITLVIDTSIVYATISYVDGKLHNSFSGRDAAGAHPATAITYAATTVDAQLSSNASAILALQGAKIINPKTYFIGGF